MVSSLQNFYAASIALVFGFLAGPASSTHNKISYLYIVGVEGVGHHGVSPAIATIARTCHMHVLYELKLLSLYRQEKSSNGFKLQLSKFGSTHYPSHKVVIIEDSSFPDAKVLRNATKSQKKASGNYDLEWTHNELFTNFPATKAKYLYLNRDFYRTVASHPEFDGGFKRHAEVLYDFIWFINSEYDIINSKQPDLWRQINYEWFTNMDTYNCTAIVSAIIDFMEWDHCDLEFACKMLQEKVRKERKKAIDPSDYGYAQTFNVTLQIPVLDISPNRTYNFRKARYTQVSVEITADPVSERDIASTISNAPGCGARSSGHGGAGGAGGGGRYAALRKQLHCPV